MIFIFIFIFGACIGSFLNVCIYRLPQDKSIITPRSFCPNCHKPLAWYDNIPLLSYILLHGRCRSCKARISFQYFAVEALNAGLYLALFFKFGASLHFLIYAVLASALVVVSFIDLKDYIVPDEITLPGIAAGLIVSLLYPPLHTANTVWPSLKDALLGLFAGGGFLYLVGLLGERIFRKEAMGGGDVKLMAMMGAFLGWKFALLSIALSSVLGSVVGLYLKFRHKAEIIPYGPYLAVGCVLSIFYGDWIIRWVFHY